MEKDLLEVNFRYFLDSSDSKRKDLHCPQKEELELARGL